MTPSPAIQYNSKFFDAISDGSLRSARVVLQVLLELCTPRSIVDVGCGTGAWLRAFAERVDDLEVKGIDGDYVDRSKLLFDQNRFVAADLTRMGRIDGRDDLALCLEVAEHLPSRVPRLVEARLNAPPWCFSRRQSPAKAGRGT